MAICDLLQGIHSSLIESEVSKTLRDIDLADKANTFAKHLSGGQKRKLSVGIAVIGDPRVRSNVLLKQTVNFCNKRFIPVFTRAINTGLSSQPDEFNASLHMLFL